MKEGHYYKIYYTQKGRENSFGDSNHCFEGLGIVTKNSKGNLILCDTYWNINGDRGRTFTRKDILKKVNNEEIEIEHYVDSNKLEKIEKYYKDYYDDKDIFIITRQHACSQNCIYYFKKKGAEKSAKKMKKVLLEKIEQEEKGI